MRLSTILEDAAAGSISASAIATNPFTTRRPIVKRRVNEFARPYTEFKPTQKHIWMAMCKRAGCTITTKADGTLVATDSLGHMCGEFGLVRRFISGSSIGESALANFDVTTAILFEVDQSKANEATVKATNDKVSNAFKRSELDTNTQTSTFGLQDGDGKVVKVTVNRDNAQEFENRLNAILSDTEQQKEIAEIIFMLRKDYDIIDVEWGEPITEDEEQPEEPASDDAGAEGGDDLGDLDPGEGDDATLDLTDMGGDDTPSPDLQKSTVELLQQVVDLLKSETQLRTASAETQIADIEDSKQDREIARQQEIADMEQYEEQEKERKKNERLAQRIAKYRSAKGAGDVNNG